MKRDLKFVEVAFGIFRPDHLPQIPLLFLGKEASTLITNNRPADDWGRLLGDSAAVLVRSAQLANPNQQPRRKRMAGFNVITEVLRIEYQLI